MSNSWKTVQDNWGPITLGLVVVVALVSAYATLYIQSEIEDAGANPTAIQQEFRVGLALAQKDAAHNKEGIEDLKDGQKEIDRKLDDLIQLMLERGNN